MSYTVYPFKFISRFFDYSDYSSLRCFPLYHSDIPILLWLPLDPISLPLRHCSRLLPFLVNPKFHRVDPISRYSRFPFITPFLYPDSVSLWIVLVPFPGYPCSVFMCFDPTWLLYIKPQPCSRSAFGLLTLLAVILLVRFTSDSPTLALCALSLWPWSLSSPSPPILRPLLRNRSHLGQEGRST